MKRGDIFVHAQWLNSNNDPLLCEVTAVRQGHVFYRHAGDDGKATACFSVDEQRKRVMPVSDTQHWHFFASSVGEWQTSCDVTELCRVMRRSGLEFTVWLVPVPLATPYEIRSYRPQVVGAKCLGKLPPT